MMDAPHPGPGNRAIGAAVAADPARIVEGAGGRIGPAGPLRLKPLHGASRMRMGAVAAVEIDPLPIDEAVACPDGGEAERVEVVDRKRPPAADPLPPRIEPDRKSLPHDSPMVAADFDRGGEKRPVVVEPPGIGRRRGRAAAGSLGEGGEIVGGDRDVGLVVVPLQKRLAEVVDDVVLLARHHPALGHHLASTNGERGIEGEGIGAALEGVAGKPRGCRERARGFERAVAICADAAIDRRAAFERPAGSFGIAPFGNKPGMVDLLLVSRRRRPGEERRIGLERCCRGSPAAGHRFEIRHEIQKLPAARQQIGKPGWHERHGKLAALVDRALVDNDLAAR